MLVNITSKAWALPILSNMHDGVAGRQATLLTATGASRYRLNPKAWVTLSRMGY